MSDEFGYSNQPFASVGEFGGIDYAQQNKGVTPIFFIEPELDGGESEKQGRAVYREMERVRIMIAGDMLSAAVHPVDDGIKARFPDQYERWQKHKTARSMSGTPLQLWPPATPVQIKELEAINIYTVEDLAAVADSNIARIPEGRQWRERAEAWLKQAKDGATAMKFAAENERLREDLSELRKQVTELSAKVAEEHRPARRGKVDA